MVTQMCRRFLIFFTHSFSLSLPFSCRQGKNGLNDGEGANERERGEEEGSEKKIYAYSDVYTHVEHCREGGSWRSH